MAATRARQVKTLEKVLLGIRACSIEKLQQLNSEFVDHQEWLRQTIADTKEHKDALGLVCPKTTRKAKKGTSVMAKASEQQANVHDDAENMENGTNAGRPPRKGKAKGKAPLQEVTANDNLSVFDLEDDSPESEEPPSKQAKTNAGKAAKGAKQARGKDKSEASEGEPKKQSAEEGVEVHHAEKKAPDSKKKPLVDHSTELQKLKVVDLRAELQKYGLPRDGTKADLVSRLNAAMMSEEFSKDESRPKLLLGRDIKPTLNMRVLHVMGTEHGSSKGVWGTIEYIPGRGASNPNERSVSVRWVADLSDIRGPYYTGESCDRGSGIGDSKFDLYCFEDADRDIFPEVGGGLLGIEGLQADERDEQQQQQQQQSQSQSQQQQQQQQDVVIIEDEDVGQQAQVQVAPAVQEQDKAEPEDIAPVLQKAQASEAVKKDSYVPVEETSQRGTKRNSDGEPVAQMKQASEQVHEPSPATAHNLANTQAGSAATLMQKLGAVRQAWTERAGEPSQQQQPTPTAKPVASIMQQTPKDTIIKPTATTATPQPEVKATAAPVVLSAACSVPAATSSTTPDSTGTTESAVSDSVQQFRAIMSRIHSGHTPTALESSTPGSARASAPRVLSTHKPATEQLTNKNSTWPIAAAPQAYKAMPEHFTQSSSGRHSASSEPGVPSTPSALTVEALNAHIQASGKADPLQMMGVCSSKAGAGAGSVAAMPKVLDVRVSQVRVCACMCA
jgi:hypothetical protein